MDEKEYLLDPCGTSSLPYWKTEQIKIPAHMAVIRDDHFSADIYHGADEPYFKLFHDLKQIEQPALCEPFAFIRCDFPAFAKHINECYAEVGVSSEELCAYAQRPVYHPELWVAIRDTQNDRIVATGIAELDTRIGEGILEWIQVSPDYRRKGLGKALVCELLQRMKCIADFVTVSGRVNNPDHPFALYLSCGFKNPVIWHVIVQK